MMMVQCDICPKQCRIAPGQSGECRIRVNLDGKLLAVTTGYPCAVHVDPVEKKPLFHFLPATGILSIATAGCNLHCRNCQNWEISQGNPEDVPARELPAEMLPRLAKKYQCRSIACTYTEPNVFYEYALDACMKSHEAGLKTVLVTAGYINPEPMTRLYRHVDAANIDLKSMSDRFYQDICGARLGPVLQTLEKAKDMGVLVEVTNLIIPELNDSDEELIKLSRWVARNLGADTPLHFSRFHPQYRMRNLPPTPAETLERAREIARTEGLHFVYLGNILAEDAANTYCPDCSELLIERSGYQVLRQNVKEGRCKHCGTAIEGVWQ
jgi:pyruvate formate lyase activating enzyme